MILKKLIFKNKKLLLNRISVSPMCQYSAKNGFKKKIKQYSRGF